MIDLTDDITISPNTYTHLQLVKCELDIRSGVGTFFYAPVTRDANLIVLGEETQQAQGTVKYMYPQIVRSVSIAQNLQHQDAAIAALWQGFLTCFDAVDDITAPLFAGQVIEIGVTEWPLAGTSVSTGSRKLAHTLIDQRPSLGVAITVESTVDPTIEIT